MAAVRSAGLRPLALAAAAVRPITRSGQSQPARRLHRLTLLRREVKPPVEADKSLRYGKYTVTSSNC